MRRTIGFVLAGVVALWLVGFVPASASTIGLALVVGVGVAGGRAAGEPMHVLALAGGAFLGAASSGYARGLAGDGPDMAAIATGSAVVAIVVGVAGLVAHALNAAARPASPPRR
ncbi:MAG: hypothetical protein EPO36_07435 [Chloroflexota bacterium]|nr:MAG: hypothetical protein EPO36_07435 [Chloroflexota bacterium]